MVTTVEAPGRSELSLSNEKEPLRICRRQFRKREELGQRPCS